MYEKKRAGKGAPFKALKEVPSVRLENAVATFRILQVGNAKLQQIPMCLLDSNDLHLLLPLLTNRIVLVARKRGRARYWSNQAANTNGVPAATKRLKKKKKKKTAGFPNRLGYSRVQLSWSLPQCCVLFLVPSSTIFLVYSPRRIHMANLTHNFYLTWP